MRYWLSVQTAFLAVFLVIIGVSLFTNRPNSDQKLELCLRELFSSDLGYTLIGCKPVSFENCNSIRYDDKTKKALFEFLTATFNKSEEYIIRIGKFQRYSIFPQVMLIHKKALLRTIRNEPLLHNFIHNKFKTKTRFLKELTNQEIDIFSLLGGNEILVGIVLGYGRANSIFYTQRCSAGRYLNKFPVPTALPFDPKITLRNVLSIVRHARPAFRISLPQYDIKKFSSLEQYWEWIKGRETETIFCHPPILIEFPGFVACKGKKARIILKKFHRARNSLANLFCHKTYKEVLMEKTFSVEASTRKQKLDDQDKDMDLIKSGASAHPGTI